MDMHAAQDDRAAAAVLHTSLLPGLCLTVAIASAAFLLRHIPGIALFSPMILAILMGMALNNIAGTPAWAKAGVLFSLRRVLRAGIVLLGFQLMPGQVAQIGLMGVGIIIATMLATFVFTRRLGRMMGVTRSVTDLIGAGTSICGASAVIAANTVVQGSDEDVAYAVACVTIFGSLAMFVYPLLPGLLHLGPRAFGLWSGSSIHEIAQVVAAAFQDGPQAGDFATVSKLTRVMLLAPLVIGLGLAGARRAGSSGHKAAAPVPWFVLGFLAVMCLNGAVPIPAPAKADIVALTTFLLSVALAAMGLETDFRKLKAEGLRPLALAAAASLFISLFSLALIVLTAYS